LSPWTKVSAASDTVRMRKLWTPPWPWVFGVATGLGVFSWLQPEDLLVIDSAGLRINPPATAIAHFRSERR